MHRPDKKWLVLIGFIVIIGLVLLCGISMPKEKSISNLYIIPAGSFNPFSWLPSSDPSPRINDTIPARTVTTTTMNPTPNVSTTDKTTLPTTTVKYLTSPYISINDIPTHYVGESFSIDGWSNLPGGSRFHIDIMQQLGRHPQHGDVIVGFSSDTILNTSESRDNYWSVQVETSGFVPASYDITITAIDNPQVWNRAYFTITAAPEPS